MFGLVRGHFDRKHELALLDLQLKRDTANHLHRMEEASIKADAAALSGAYEFASKPVGYKWVEAIVGLVRPGITVGFFGLYTAVKLAFLSNALAVGNGWQASVISVWTAADMEIFGSIMGFWFGQRARQRASR